MSAASIIGVGMVPFGKFPERTLADIAWPAVKAALADANLGPADIEACYCGTALGGPGCGPSALGP